MNLTTPTTMGELRRLIAEADDLAGAHVLWIDTGGEVHLSAAAGDCDDSAVRLRFAPFEAGAGMVGPLAAHDDRLIGKMYFSILHHWLHAGDAPRDRWTPNSIISSARAAGMCRPRTAHM